MTAHTFVQMTQLFTIRDLEKSWIFGFTWFTPKKGGSRQTKGVHGGFTHP